MKKIILGITLLVGFMQLIFCQQSQSIRYKNRIGLNIGGGSGFKSFKVGELTDGTDVTISFGGGFVFNFEYGHEFNRHFDLAVSIGGQSSELDQTVDNASMNFSHTNLSLTPSFILPLGARDKMRLKFGVGIDWIYASNLNIDMGKVPGGFNDDWKYNNTLGEHLNILLEIKLRKRFSLNAGLNLYNANYTFKSGGSRYPIDQDLKSPNGSGIGFLIGAHYHFNWRKIKS